MRYALLTLILCEGVFADVAWRVPSRLTVIPGTQITLAKVLETPALSTEGQKLLSQTVLAEAGASGSKLEISESSLKAAIRPLLLAERKRTSGKIQLTLPEKITIAVESRELTLEAVTAELVRTWQSLCADCRLEIESLGLPQANDVSDWSIHATSELPHGTFSLPITLLKANKPATKAWISGRLVIKRRVPVVNRAVGINERLQIQDVDWDYRDTSFSIDSAPTAEELKGKKVRQGLRVGDILWRGMLEKEKAIRRGEQVQVRSGDASWEVWLNVVAQQDAAIGDVIEFKNPKTNGTFLGEVVGSARVELR